MGISRWGVLGAVIPLLAGCGGGSSNSDDRVDYAIFAGFGSASSASTIAESITLTRSVPAAICNEEEEVEGVTQASDNALESEHYTVSLPLALLWINNTFEAQSVEIDGFGFEVSIYQEVDGGDDVLVWNTYDNLWLPDTGKDQSEAAAIRADDELTDEEKDAEIEALEDLTCFKPENEFDSTEYTQIDIPQSERLPPHTPGDWPVAPEVANTIALLFNGWSESGDIEAVAGEYYAEFKFDIKLAGGTKPEVLRRDFTIVDPE